MSRLGTFALSGVVSSLAAPAFQTRATGGVTTGTSMTVTMPSGLVAGDFILVIVGGGRTNTAPTTVLATYTKMAELFQVSGSSGGFVSIWGKVAVGGDSNPSFSVTTTNTNMTYIAERWSGVVGFSTALTGVGYTTSGAFTMTANSVTTTVANSVVLTAIGGRGLSSGDVSQTWGAGAVGAYDTASGRIGFCNNAVETLAATGTRQHTAAITNSQGAPASCIASVILAPA